MRRRSPAVFILLTGIGVLIFIGINQTVPSQHLPWRKLDIEAPTGLSTHAQMLRLSLSSSQTCMKIADGAVTFSSARAEPKSERDVCGYTIARDVLGSDDGLLARQTVMQCPLAIGAYIWTREIDRLARKHLKSPLKTILHFGSYSCRRQNGNSSGEWSEHAFANAWDVSGFELEDGTRISVLDHWSKGSRAERKFLRGVREQACRIFRVTLSPDYNAAHKNHFHVDMGPWATCS